MKNLLLYPTGVSSSSRYASDYLRRYGVPQTDHPTPEITHLLLDVPSFNAADRLKNGTNLTELLRMLPETTTIIGGNLSAILPPHRNTIDLLKDDIFLAKNAAITAECALQVAAPYLTATYADSPALILGWGRIGKHLARLLDSLRCKVTVAARRESDRALLKSFGYHAVDFSEVTQILPDLRILFNTVPLQLLDRKILDLQKDIIKIDLASLPGMVCEDIIPARGLPGKYAPESSGKLIAQTICRLLKEDGV